MVIDWTLDKILLRTSPQPPNVKSFAEGGYPQQNFVQV